LPAFVRLITDSTTLGTCDSSNQYYAGNNQHVTEVIYQ
jgi:hypothetical protein